MMKTIYQLGCALGFLAISLTAQAENECWESLFNGKDLSNWKVTQENPGSITVKDGMIVINGPRAHAFYNGEIADHNFTNFEFKAKVKTMPKANSGIYFHTKYQDEGWPYAGYEAQVNNTHGDWRKTGSLYAIKDNREIPAKDGEWFDYFIKVEGHRVWIKINGELVTDYTQPEKPDHLKDYPGRFISSGTFALQAHDPGSVVYYKDLQVRTMP
jgi:hypothetical protein